MYICEPQFATIASMTTKSASMREMILEEPIAKEVQKVPMQDEMSESFLSYAMSVVTARALPDVRDGLKPVQRRILYAMLKMGLRPDSPHRKSARVVGETMGKYHPHGDAAIYETLVRMGQNFARNIPMVHPQGNFGSLDDPPAASRYTECRLSEAAFYMMFGIDENTVDFASTYDGETSEPSCLPSAIPNLLVNGSAGIAVGMSTNMLPFNLQELAKVLDMVLGKVFDEKRSSAKTFVKQTLDVSAAQLLKLKPEQLLDVQVSEIEVPEKLQGVRPVKLSQMLAEMPGPDFPSGGSISEADMESIYMEGTGSVTVDAKTEIVRQGRTAVLIATELPWQVGPEKVVAKIKEGKENGKLDFVKSVANLSDRKSGTAIHVHLKSSASPASAAEKLMQQTPLRMSYRVNNVVLAAGVPKTLGMFDLCRHYIYHRINVTIRYVHSRRTKAMLRREILEGYLKALADIDAVVKIIRTSPDTETARQKLIKRLKITARQADAILELRLKRLTDMEANRIEDERKNLTEEIEQHDNLLSDETALKRAVRKSFKDAAKQFGQPRKTKIG